MRRRSVLAAALMASALCVLACGKPPKRGSWQTGTVITETKDTDDLLPVMALQMR